MEKQKNKKAVISAAVIQQGEILLAKKKDVWILPGGKQEDQETNEECLLREFSEELPGATVTIGEYFGKFSGTTPHSKRQVTVHVYFATIQGGIAPGAEISAAEWFSEPEKQNLSDITRAVIVELKEKGYL